MEIIMDPIKEYYDYLKSAGANVAPTVDSFKRTLGDPAAAKEYYNYLRSSNFNTPDTFESFSRTLGIGKKKDVSGQASQLSYSPYVSPRPDAPKKGDLPLGVPNTQRSFNQELFNAKNAIGEAINNSDDILKRMIREDRVNIFERQQQNVPGLDNFKNPAAASAKKFLLTQSEIKDEELVGKKQQAQQDDALAREVIKRKKDPVLARSAYLVDAQERVVNNPNKEADIISNADKIARGELTYNIKRGVLQQPQGALESAIRGFRERQKQLDDYEFMSQADDAKLLERLEKDMATFDPDKPVPVPDGASAQFAEMFGMEGIPMLKSSGAAIATGLIPGAQGAAPFVAAAASSPEYYKRSYASALRDTYYQLRNRGKSPEEALKVARDQANKEGIAGAAEGAVSSALGAKIGFKPTSLAPSTTNALNKVVMASKDFIVRNAPEAVTDAGAASLIQIASNIAAIDNGLDRNVLDGVQESAGSEFLFTVGVGTLTTGGRALVDPKTYRTILNGFARQPKDVVNAKIGEMVTSGVITPEQATQVGKDLENERALDAQIPSTVRDDFRPEITPRIEERNKLKQELSTVNEAFHPQIKDKIKAIDQEILTYATNESGVQEGRTEGNISQPQGAGQGQQEVGQGTGIQGQATQPQANVGDSNIGGQGQVAGQELSNIERITPESIQVSSDATDFAQQMESAQSSLGRMGMSVSPYAQEDYDQIASEGGKFLRAAGNKVLSLLKPNGEMVSLVKDASVKAKGAAQAMISRMKDMGGLFMDNYDIYLTPIYEKAGYKVVARVPFNEQYAPEGWNAEDSPLKNKPDVVFMVRNDIAPEQAQTFTDYEEAQNYTQGLVDQAVKEGVAKLPTQMTKIDEALGQAIPKATQSLQNAGIKFQVVDAATDTEAARAARGNQGLFVSEDGTIIIDRSKLADDIEAGIVVWHEASHPVMNIIRNTNKPLYDSVVRGLQKAAKTNDGVAKAMFWAKSQPEYDNVDTQNDEAVVETIARINSGLIDVSKLDTGLRQKLIDFVNAIAKYFGINPILDDTDLAAFKKTVSQVADALKTGRDIGEIVGQENVGKFKATSTQARSIAEMRDNDVETKVKPGRKVSTRTPGGKGSPTDVHTSDAYIVDLKSQRKSPDNYIINALDIADYPVIKGVKKSDIAALKRGLVPKSKGGNEQDQKAALKVADKIYEKFVTAVADNLVWLHDQFDEGLRTISRRWYDGANKIAQDFSSKFGITTEQAAGVIASLSPQMDWYKNVSLAERVIDIVKNKKDFVFDQAMADRYIEIAGTLQKKKNETPAELEQRKAQAIADAKEETALLMGKPIGENTTLFPKALRAYDEVYNDKSYDILSPNAEVIGKAKTMSGENAKIGWQGFKTIAKAVSIVEDGSPNNISIQLGTKHKIRNFNNNIIDPNSAGGDVTIDTHAVAAGLLKPLAGADNEVKLNLSGKSSKNTGSTGTYPAFADAYRLAAEKVGILPRQMQSITWEAVRGLFTDKYKSNKANKQKINEIWDQYAQGKIDIDETRRQINNAAGGVKTPSWARSGDQALVADESSDNTGELLEDGTMGDDGGADIGDTGGSEAGMVRPASDQASVGNRNIFNEELPDSIINSVRASLRKKAPDSTTLQYLDELQAAKKDNTFVFEGPVSEMLDNGVTLNNIASMLLDDEIFEDARQIRNYFNNIGGPDGVGILLKMNLKMQASVGNRGELLAPNGKPSNLTPKQYEQVRTPQFKNWFGDWENDPANASKVVDENGEPLVVYHGSVATDIEIFDRLLSKRESSGLKEMGIYFTTNKNLSELYAKAPLSEETKNDIRKQIDALNQKLDKVRSNREFENITSEIDALENKIKGRGGKVYEAFLNLRKVKEFDAKGKNGVRAWDNLQVDAGYKIAQNRDAMDFLMNGKFGVEQVDGIIARNIADIESYGAEDITEEFKGTVYLVFDDKKNSIKSATDNTGEFSTKDNRIQASVGNRTEDDLRGEGTGKERNRALSTKFGALDPQTQAKIDEDAITYFQRPNKQTAKAVEEFIDGQNLVDMADYVLSNPDIPEVSKVWMAAEVAKRMNAEIAAATDQDLKDALTDKQAAIYNEFAKKATDLGQAVQAFIAFKQDPSAVEFFLPKILRELKKKGVDKVTEGQRADIVNLLREVNSAADGIPKDKAIIKMSHYLGRLAPMKPMDVLQALWYAKILSGITTQSTNFFANIFNTAFELPAVALRVALLNKAPLSLAAGAKGFGSGIVKGAVAAADIMKSGVRSKDADKLFSENPLEYFTWSQWLGPKGKALDYVPPLNFGAWKYVGRMLAATDALFSTANQEAIANMLAYAEAAGTPGGNNFKKAQTILGNTKQDVANAKAQATAEGFNPKTLQGRRRVIEIIAQGRKGNEEADMIGKRITMNYDPEGWTRPIFKAVVGLTEDIPVIKMVIPFARIVANLTENGLNYTPLGLIRAATGLRNPISKKKGEMTTEERIDLFNKFALGTTALVALIGNVGEDDDDWFEITAGGSNDVQEKYELQKGGWRPYTITLKDGTKISYKDWPIAGLLAGVGHIRDAKKYKFDDSSQMALYATGFFLNFYDKSLVSGLNDFFGMVHPTLGRGKYAPETTGVDRLKKYAAQQVRSVAISNMSQQAGKMYSELVTGDPQRDAKTFMEVIYRDLPMFNDGIRPIIDVFGEEVKYNTTERLTPTSNPESDKIIKWLNENKFFVGVPKKGNIINADDSERPMNDAEYYEFRKIYGKYVKENILELMDDIKDSDREIAEEAFSDAKKFAREQAYEDILDKYGFK